MYKTIKEVLEPTGLNVFNITRGEAKAPCVVVNDSLINSMYSDNGLEAREYLININLILIDDTEERKVEVENILRSHKFTEIKIMPSLQDSEGFFNTPIKAKFIKERR